MKIHNHKNSNTLIRYIRHTDLSRSRSRDSQYTRLYPSQSRNQDNQRTLLALSQLCNQGRESR
jgi:hypothetical protein